MSDPFATMDAYIERLRTLPKLAKEAAPDVAHAVRVEGQRTIAAGTDAYGKSWQANEDGSQPLKTAGSKVFVTNIGTRILVVVKGYIARHHKRTARGGIAREVIPTKGIPPAMSKAIGKVVETHFHEHMEVT